MEKEWKQFRVAVMPGLGKKGEAFVGSIDLTSFEKLHPVHKRDALAQIRQWCNAVDPDTIPGTIAPPAEAEQAGECNPKCAFCLTRRGYGWGCDTDVFRTVYRGAECSGEEYICAGHRDFLRHGDFKTVILPTPPQADAAQRDAGELVIPEQRCKWVDEDRKSTLFIDGKERLAIKKHCGEWCFMAREYKQDLDLAKRHAEQQVGAVRRESHGSCQCKECR